MMKKWIAVLLAALLLMSFSACGADEAQSAGQTAGKAAGESFTLGKETYALEKWVLLPEYDTDTMRGYGLCLVQQEAVAPIKITSQGYSSLVDATLDVGGTELPTRNISFIKTDGAPGYAARVTFEFALDKGEALPASATMRHADTKEEQRLDLSALAAPVAASAQTEEAAAQEETEAPVIPQEGLALCGDWLLTGVRFYTPEQDNGIYAIDGTMGLFEGYDLGRDLRLLEDGTFSSDINISALIEEVNELPFTAADLDFNAYGAWEFQDNLILPAPDGPALHVEEASAEGELQLKNSRTVEIESIERDGAMTKDGRVDIEITLILERA
ncbi:MAG: hypothetical protein Q4E65_07380 [Clostridia bacterium]|nr:hypothetical protein [Clostridia bacterium]